MEGTCGVGSVCILSMLKVSGVGCGLYCCDIISLCFCSISCGISLRYCDMLCIVWDWCGVGGGSGVCDIGGGGG